MQRQEGGFTLLEVLLVVFAIIGLVFGVVMFLAVLKYLGWYG